GRAVRVGQRLGDSGRPSSGLTKVALPFVEEPLDMAALLRREVELVDDAPRFGSVVVSDRGLEMLAERLGLSELTSQPAQQAHPCSPLDRLETHGWDSRRFADPGGW